MFCKPFKVNDGTAARRRLLRGLKTRRSWATDDNRKRVVFLVNLLSHYHFSIVTYFFISRYYKFENLRESTFLGCEMFTSVAHPWLKHFASLSSLLSKHDDNRDSDVLSYLRWSVIGLLQQTITWYMVAGQAHYYSRTGTLKQRDLNQWSSTCLCFDVRVRE